MGTTFVHACAWRGRGGARGARRRRRGGGGGGARGVPNTPSLPRATPYLSTTFSAFTVSFGARVFALAVKFESRRSSYRRHEALVVRVQRGAQAGPRTARRRGPALRPQHRRRPLQRRRERRSGEGERMARRKEGEGEVRGGAGTPRGTLGRTRSNPAHARARARAARPRRRSSSVLGGSILCPLSAPARFLGTSMTHQWLPV